MRNQLSIVWSLFLFLSTHLGAQNTVGVIQNEANSLQGYTFFSPFSGTKAYLVDNCGRLVNEWDRGTRPGLAAYFLDNGLMLRTFKPAPLGPFTSASNAGGLELVDWDNNTVWSYELNTATRLSHHDAVHLPNGNFLMLTWELVFANELVELGRDPNEIASQGFMWSERIIEVQPVGTNDVNIVWEWQIKDHYIQDFDPSKQDFGVIADHPERFDINLPELNSSNSNASRDWNHFNAIDYHLVLDQILISVRNSDEIWIIDHSTTTIEAAGEVGGHYGKGGDILYRWGNASAYDRAALNAQRLFGQHGVHWIKEGLDDSGKILIFNNGNGRPGTDFSTIEILTPPQDSTGFYTIPVSGPIGPLEPDWIYGDKSGETFYSPYLSNAQRLSNGNMLINSGSPGVVFEIDMDERVVWEYVIPLFGDLPATQGQSVSNNGNFRAYKYDGSYPGFDGKDLSSGNTIETGTNPDDCQILVAVNENEIAQKQFLVRYHRNENTIEIANPRDIHGRLSLLTVDGRILQSGQLNGGSLFWPIDTLKPGLYFLSIRDDRGKVEIHKLMVLN